MENHGHPQYASGKAVIMKTKVVISIFLALGVLYFAGPAPKFSPPDAGLPSVPEDPEQLEKYIQEKENNPRIKSDNEARIIWFDSMKTKTPFSIIYLHGFRASQKEGDPIHRRIAKAFGCNLYLNRLPEHGIDTPDAFIHFTADKLWENVKEALAIGKSIGDKVIIISTSTGGTAAIYLASQFPGEVYALVNMSPNIEINEPTAFLLNNHWGISLAKLVKGGNYLKFEEDSISAKYWTPTIRIESLGQLEEFVEQTMRPATFSNVKIPSLTLYYYKNETEQDPVLKVEAMLRMNSLLASPDSLKSAVAVPTAGAHCMGSSITSKDVDKVYNQIELFLTDKVKLKKLHTQ
jgi:esterase/lipase